MKKLLIVLLLLFSNPVYADGLYVGAGLGIPKYKTVDTKFVNAQLGAANAPFITTDPSGQSFTLFVGYRLNKFFAIEGGYIDLGEYTVTGSGVRPGPSGVNTTSLDNTFAQQTGGANGSTLALVGHYPVSESFSVFAKGGAFHWQADNNQSSFTTRTTTTTDPVTGIKTISSETLSQISARISDHGTNPVFGVGFTLDGDDIFNIRGEVERTEVGKDGSTGKSHVDTFSLSLIFKF